MDLLNEKMIMAGSNIVLLGALVVTHAMLRRLTSWRCIIILLLMWEVEGIKTERTLKKDLVGLC